MSCLVHDKARVLIQFQGLIKTVNSKNHSMTSEHIQISIDVDSDQPTESMQLKLTFLERRVQRIKDQNCRLMQKLQRAESQNEGLKLQKKSFDENINRLTEQLKKKDKQIQRLMQNLQVRTRRHQSQLSQNISKSQKQEIERRIVRAEENAALFRLQKEVHLQKYLDLVDQLQSYKQQKASLLTKIEYLQQQLLKDTQQIAELQSLYQKKMIILEKQKAELAKHNDSLSLELKLLNNKKQIEGLLDYQSKIGKDNPDPTTNRTYVRSTMWQAGPQSYLEMEQQLIEAEQLINLLKQRNIRVCSQLQAVKKRCSVLQSIICSSN